MGMRMQDWLIQTLKISRDSSAQGGGEEGSGCARQNVFHSQVGMSEREGGEDDRPSCSDMLVYLRCH